MTLKRETSRAPFDARASAPDFLAPIAPEATTFAQFPTVQQLLDHESGRQPHPLLQLTEMKPPSEPPSLFDGLMGGQLHVLSQDVLDHPERYDDATQAFITELGERDMATLSPGEKKLLDSAVLDFAAYRPPTAPASPQSKTAARRKKPQLIDDDEMQDAQEMPFDAPSEVASFWWL